MIYRQMTGIADKSKTSKLIDLNKFATFTHTV